MTATPFGVVPVLKLPGPTSHDLVRRARRAYGVRRVGHGGTLDPAAAGVLPILLGPATRLSRYLLEGDKSYRFIVAFGAETDTDDQEGRVVRRAPLPGLAALDRALGSFTGRLRQVPPRFSAVKHEGRTAHRAARAGEELRLPAREVTVARLVRLRFEGTADAVARAVFDADCSHGTYVRALARDIARAAGSAGHLAALLRTRTGPFDLSSARTLEEGDEPPPWLPPETALAGHEHVPLSGEEASAVAHGCVPATLAARLASSAPDPEGDAALMWNGRLLAVAGRPGPRVVLRAVFAEVAP